MKFYSGREKIYYFSFRAKDEAFDGLPFNSRVFMKAGGDNHQKFNILQLHHRPWDQQRLRVSLRGEPVWRRPCLWLAGA